MYSINVIGFFPQVKNARRILGRLSADADACRALSFVKAKDTRT